MIADTVMKQLEDYFECNIAVESPGYLEVVGPNNELLGTLEASKDGWQLRVDGELVELL